jgi:hypothetical protein
MTIKSDFRRAVQLRSSVVLRQSNERTDADRNKLLGNSSEVAQGLFLADEDENSNALRNLFRTEIGPKNRYRCPGI